MARTISDRMPRTYDGLNPVNGNKKPVTLVATVVVRKILFHPANHLDVSSPYNTTKPAAMPISLRTTWNEVNAAHMIFS